MQSGIKVKELVVGTGKIAEGGKIVVAHVRAVLRRGDEIFSTHTQGQPAIIDLTKREHVAGLRKGIEGMRVGGKRELVVSPHLAYGEEGVPGSVPANAVVRFEVELLDVREPGVSHLENYPPGKQLLVFHPGEAARKLARWQFGLREADSAAGASITIPVPGLTWRHARLKNVELKLSQSEMGEILQSAQTTLAEHPKACLQNEQMWADASEKANSITRDRATDILCVTVSLFERGVCLLNYGLPETSPVLLTSRFYQIISKALAPHLADKDDG